MTLTPRPFATLSPDRVLQAAEAAGLAPDGRLFALNSYENRVYRVGCDAGAVVLKFYRAERWSDAQIAEEHEFALELAAADLPVAAPLRLQQRTLHHWEDLRFAVFPLCPGAAPDLSLPGQLELLGRTLARWHAQGARRRFELRPRLLGEQLGARARRTVLASALLPEGCAARYATVSGWLLERIEEAWQRCGPLQYIRLHGDCHLGNILWRATGPLFVDLDDCVSGPRIQDLWMFLSGSPDEQRGQWQQLLAGYRQFGDLDFVELQFIEALRAARMLNHAAWVAERWPDPAFPAAFPWFGEVRFWEQYCNDLAEQCEAVSAPPLLA
ncbi:MAG: serine/threonine protein kinase [Steroidobacteraceae bacterium]